MSGKRKYNKIKKAFSMVELTISITVILLLTTLLLVQITKNAEKISLDEVTSGKYICYKDANGALHESVNLMGKNKKVQRYDREVSACNFEFPESATAGTIYLIGGGGGGGSIGNWELNQINDTNYPGSATVTKDKFNPLPCSEPAYYVKDKYLKNTYVGTISVSEKVSRQIEIPDELRGIIDNNTYNNEILKNYIISVKGGSRSKKANFQVSPKVGDYYACYEGIDVTKEEIDGEEYTIAPSPGIVKINGTMHIAKGFTMSLNGRPEYYDEKDYEGTVAKEQYYYSYSYKTLGNTVSLPFGTAGNPGHVRRINPVNLYNLNAAHKLTINSASIGNAGRGGRFKQTPTSGGNTTLTIAGANQTALGGAAGTTGKETIGLEYDGSHNEKFVQTTNASVGNYISTTDYPSLLAGVIQSTTYQSHPTTCRDDLKTCLKGADADSKSYGAGGGAQNTMLKYYPSVNNLIITRLDTNAKIVDESAECTLEYIYENTARNGNGGAIIIEWGN